MTAPVFEEVQTESKAQISPGSESAVIDSQSEGWNMFFVLPSEYTWETVPKPLHSAVSLRHVPARKVAVIRYSGFFSEANIEKKTKELRKWLEVNEYTALSSPLAAGYDPPWTIPFLRRNEVQIEVQ